MKKDFKDSVESRIRVNYYKRLFITHFPELLSATENSYSSCAQSVRKVAMPNICLDENNGINK